MGIEGRGDQGGNVQSSGEQVIITPAIRCAVALEIWQMAYIERYACGYALLWEFERRWREAGEL